MALAPSEKASQNPILDFGDILLRGSGQVMLQNHPVTGLLFLVGIGWGSVAAGTPQVAVGAFLGLLFATLTAMWLRVEPESLKQGLYGFNGLLVGAALPTFLGDNWRVWVLVSLGGIASTITFMAMTNVLKTWGVAALTFPFVLVTWVFCFGAYSFADVPIGSLMPPQMASHVTTSTASQADSALFWFEATANGISQVFLIGNPVTGIIFVLALAASSRWAAGLAVLSSILAVATAVAFGADATSVQNGLFGFSSVLTAIALGCTFYKPSLHVLAYTAVGVVSTVFAQAGLDAMVLPLGVVTLTAPFVFTTWVFLLAKTEL